MAREYIVPISWQMRGFVKINAESAEEALANVMNVDDIPIPADARYVEGSCQIDTEDTDSVEMYTDAYDSGDLCCVPEEYGEEES